MGPACVRQLTCSKTLGAGVTRQRSTAQPSLPPPPPQLEGVYPLGRRGAPVRRPRLADSSCEINKLCCLSCLYAVLMNKLCCLWIMLSLVLACCLPCLVGSSALPFGKNNGGALGGGPWWSAREATRRTVSPTLERHSVEQRVDKMSNHVDPQRMEQRPIGSIVSRASLLGARPCGDKKGHRNGPHLPRAFVIAYYITY